MKLGQPAQSACGSVTCREGKKSKGMKWSALTHNQHTATSPGYRLYSISVKRANMAFRTASL